MTTASKLTTWPDERTEKMMLEDAALIESEFEPTSAGHETACHVKALLARVRELEAERGRLRAALDKSRPLEHVGHSPYAPPVFSGCPGCESERLRKEALEGQR